MPALRRDLAPTVRAGAGGTIVGKIGAELENQAEAHLQEAVHPGSSYLTLVDHETRLKE